MEGQKTLKDKKWNILFPETDNGKPLHLRFSRKRDRDEYKAVKAFLRKLEGSGKGGKPPRRAVRPDLQGRQPCMVKMTYGGSAEAHKKFLSHYMPQVGKEGVSVQPELFGNVTEARYKADMAPSGRHYKFILSPGTPMSADELKTFTQLWMAKASRDTGIKFEWQAAVHTDTGHPHVHVLINGQDIDGNAIRRIPPDFVRSFGRQNASDILTSMLGTLSRKELDAAKERQLEADRWTPADAEIEGLAASLGAVGGKQAFIPVTFPAPRLRRRMEHLQGLGLASVSSGCWKLRDGWQDDLRALGRYNMYFDAAKFISPLSKLRLYDAGTDGRITGVLRKIYTMDDETVWTNAAVVEDVRTGKAWYVPLRTPAGDGWNYGEEVTFEPRAGGRGKGAGRLVHGSGYTERQGKER